MSIRPSVFFLSESALNRGKDAILPVLGPFHRPQGWTGWKILTFIEIIRLSLLFEVNKTDAIKTYF